MILYLLFSLLCVTPTSITSFDVISQSLPCTLAAANIYSFLLFLCSHLTFSRRGTGLVPYNADCLASFAPSARIFSLFSWPLTWLPLALHLATQIASRVRCLLRIIALGADSVYASTRSFLSPRASMWLFLARRAFTRCIWRCGLVVTRWPRST